MKYGPWSFLEEIGGGLFGALTLRFLAFALAPERRRMA